MPVAENRLLARITRSCLMDPDNCKRFADFICCLMKFHEGLGLRRLSGSLLSYDTASSVWPDRQWASSTAPIDMAAQRMEAALVVVSRSVRLEFQEAVKTTAVVGLQ